MPQKKYEYENYLKFIDEASYHQRSKVETVFSVIKRKYDSVLRCKSFATQRVELINKLIVYNLDRKINYLLLILRIAPEPENFSSINFSLSTESFS